MAPGVVFPSQKPRDRLLIPRHIFQIRENKNVGDDPTFFMAPGVGFEPTTKGLTVLCATAALPRNVAKSYPSM
jgi:hypothetical protein